MLRILGSRKVGKKDLLITPNYPLLPNVPQHFFMVKIGNIRPQNLERNNLGYVHSGANPTDIWGFYH